jgi:hypothetical protein
LKRKNPTSATASLCAVVPTGVLNDPVVEVLKAAEAAEAAASDRGYIYYQLGVTA